jgi:TPR repeat protein
MPSRRAAPAGSHSSPYIALLDTDPEFAPMYWNGQGVPQDRGRAVQWWRIGAAKGNARAAGKLEDNGHHWSYFRYVVVPELLRSFVGS